MGLPASASVPEIWLSGDLGKLRKKKPAAQPTTQKLLGPEICDYVGKRVGGEPFRGRVVVGRDSLGSRPGW